MTGAEASTNNDEFDFDDISPYELIDFGEEEISIFDIVGSETLKGARNKTKDVVRNAKQKIHTKPVAKFRDKISFVVGVANLLATASIFSGFPQFMPQFFTVKAISLISFRFFSYRSAKWHYFLFDFCYFVNFLLLLYVHYFNDNASLFMACFAFSSGPLAWAIPTWRNSMVLHSVDKMTSLFIHFAPLMLTFTFRFIAHDESFAVCAREDCSASFLELSVYPLMYYVAWQVLYYIKVEVWSSKKVADEGYLTSYVCLVKQGDKTLVGKITRKAPESMQVYVFMLCQGIFTFLTLVPAYIFWHYKYVHLVFSCGILLVATWNGANFYIEVFSSRYMKDLEKLN